MSDKRPTYEELERRLAIVSDAATSLLRAQDTNSMVRELFDQVSSHLSVQAYFNFSVNGTGERLRLESLSGISEEESRLIAQWSLDQGPCGTAARMHHMVHVPDVQASADPALDTLRRYGIRAYCCYPLMAGDRLLGVLSFGSRVVDRFDDDDLDLMRTMSSYVSIAREKLRLEKELRERADQLAEADRRARTSSWQYWLTSCAIPWPPSPTPCTCSRRAA